MMHFLMQHGCFQASLHHMMCDIGKCVTNDAQKGRVLKSSREKDKAYYEEERKIPKSLELPSSKVIQ